jgi:hypothetical protein
MLGRPTPMILYYVFLYQPRPQQTKIVVLSTKACWNDSWKGKYPQLQVMTILKVALQGEVAMHQMPIILSIVLHESHDMR